MKALVTGGTGFVGSHLVRCLLERGAEVRCLVRPSSRLDNLKDLPVEFVHGDLRDSDSLRQAMRGASAVYHCAADYRLWCADPREMYESNVGGSRNVMQAAFAESVERVVYTSTVGALGLNDDARPANEETPVTIDDMIGHYKRSKYMAEEEVRRLGRARASGRHRESFDACWRTRHQADADWKNNRGLSQRQNVRLRGHRDESD